MQEETNKHPVRKTLDGSKGNASRGIFVTLLFALGIGLICVLYAVSAGIRDRQPPPVQVLPALATPLPRPQQLLSANEIAVRVVPGVVSVSLYDAGGVVAISTGSGVVLSEDGFIATNAHVVYGGKVIHVRLHNGTGYTAMLVGMDVKNDLAVLKIDETNLETPEFGDSAQLQTGEVVYAIGNATGALPGSITEGLVSGSSRQVPIATADGDTVYMELVQTSAAINPGNSGGALVNAHGQVVGITLGKVESAGVENIGFAIPINAAAQTLQAIVNREASPATPKLGVVCEALNESTGPPNGLPAAGLYIVEMSPGSSLRSAGVLPGDVLVRCGDAPLAEISDLVRALQNHQVGDVVTLSVFRFAGGQEEPVQVELLAES